MAKTTSQPRTKMVSPTFTTEEFEAIQRAATDTDRSMAAFVRWTVICYLRSNDLLPNAEEDDEDDDTSTVPENANT
jgi:hypothetical protein